MTPDRSERERWFLCPECGEYTLIRTDHYLNERGRRVAFDFALCDCGRRIAENELASGEAAPKVAPALGSE